MPLNKETNQPNPTNQSTYALYPFLSFSVLNTSNLVCETKLSLVNNFHFFLSPPSVSVSVSVSLSLSLSHTHTHTFSLSFFLILSQNFLILSRTYIVFCCRYEWSCGTGKLFKFCSNFESKEIIQGIVWIVRRAERKVDNSYTWLTSEKNNERWGTSVLFAIQHFVTLFNIHS